ncbi:hypothetical protein TUSST3_09060 [Streptomyces sp. TUS-ST3]|uniref:hypothetical protein n=1 Tax=Streptomyces sp. TUS-ST3 TaxID=3025591 RepID=UPI0024E1104A|nr:hypothetical protein [Streptomyces sp. TUS-ST3]GLP64286.1 hypothetical protein TUSST3_09060 [Streptomyces sp. TUS-ST3]
MPRQTETAEGNRQLADLADHRAAEHLERGDTDRAHNASDWATCARDMANRLDRRS